MSKTKILTGLIALFCVAFAIFQFSGNVKFSEYARSLIVPFVTVLYLVKYKPKICCFAMFLILFSLSELSIFIDHLITDEYYVLFYTICNGLYILAYGALISEIVRQMDLRRTIKNFGIHLIILTILNVAILYVLYNIVVPYLEFNVEFVIELSYNIMILMLLTVALLNYLYRDNRKSLLIFLGALLIVFSEVMLFAYFYIEGASNLFNVIYSVFMISAFYFFFKQLSYGNDEVPIMIQKEALQ